MTTLPLSRRRFIATSAAGTALLATPGLLRAAPTTLAIFGPPAGPSITMAYAVAQGAFGELAETVSFTAWRDPDELRAGLTSGTMKLVIMPANAAANLYNRGLGVRMVNAMTNGLNSVVSRDPEIRSASDLAGRKVAVPFRNDTPDILLQRVLKAEGVDPASLSITAAASPIEAVQLLLTGRADAAVLPEPATTMAEMRALQAGQQVTRVIDIQAEWGKLTGLGPVVPQAGLAVMADFDEANPGLVEAVQAALETTLPHVLADPQAAAAAASDALGMPAPVLAKSIPHCALTTTPARAAQPYFEAMFTAVAEVEPAAIGGKLPDAGFYRL